MVPSLQLTLAVMEYYVIIAASIIVVLSYMFNRIASKSGIPSVLMLILLGIVCRELIGLFDINKTTVLRVFADVKLLEVLGTLGLILIVLEAALELKIEKKKYKHVTLSFFIALMGLVLCMFAIGSVFHLVFEDMNWVKSFIYAVPLSIISSAIVIPSVMSLKDERREEFHIYESTFSDILGIMAFYLLIGIAKSESEISAVRDFSLGLIVTVVTSVVLSYLLIYIFQSLETRVKLFLMIAVLFLLFSVGKLMHLSSLLIILIFGVILNNHQFFFTGLLRKYANTSALDSTKETFLVITVESAFIVRTFFFVIFGFSIAIASLFDFSVAVISVLALIAIYGTRFLTITLFSRKRVKEVIAIAPRGLITLLLFYSIPQEFTHSEFNSGILLFVIIISSLAMTYGVVKNVRKKNKD